MRKSALVHYGPVEDDGLAVPEANRPDGGATSADFPVAGTPGSIQEILSAPEDDRAAR